MHKANFLCQHDHTSSPEGGKIYHKTLSSVEKLPQYIASIPLHQPIYQINNSLHPLTPYLCLTRYIRIEIVSSAYPYGNIISTNEAF